MSKCTILRNFVKLQNCLNITVVKLKMAFGMWARIEMWKAECQICGLFTNVTNVKTRLSDVWVVHIHLSPQTFTLMGNILCLNQSYQQVASTFMLAALMRLRHGLFSWFYQKHKRPKSKRKSKLMQYVSHMLRLHWIGHQYSPLGQQRMLCADIRSVNRIYTLNRLNIVTSF